MGSGTIGAPDRVNIPHLIHNIWLCQIDVKMRKS